MLHLETKGHANSSDLFTGFIQATLLTVLALSSSKLCRMYLKDDMFCSHTPSVTTQDLSCPSIMPLAAIKKGMGGERDFIIVSLSLQAGCF